MKTYVGWLKKLLTNPYQKFCLSLRCTWLYTCIAKTDKPTSNVIFSVYTDSMCCNQRKSVLLEDIRITVAYTKLMRSIDFLHKITIL